MAGILLWLAITAVAQSAPADKEKPTEGPPPRALSEMRERSVLLIRDPSVQSELKLTPEQRDTIGRLMDEVDPAIWALRDLSAEEIAAKQRELISRLEADLKEVLSPVQQRRLEEIVLQSRGLPAVLRPELSDRLAITEDQRQRIQAVVEKTWKALDGLAQISERGDLAVKAAERCRTEEHADISAILTEPQKQKWAALVGRRFDFSQVGPLLFKAPELIEATAWINSKPLTLAGLRGRVVAVHFYTFACINCIHNYPSYKNWLKSLVPRGVVMIGIHTPETKGEYNIEKVKAKAKENGLDFPILVDNEKKNWAAWGNHVWPSVYLVDKRGRVRYWWYGELNWQGKEGEKYMAARMEELMAEKQ